MFRRQNSAFYALENICTLYESGVPLTQCIVEVSHLVQDEEVAKKLRRVVTNIESGDFIWSSFQEQDLFSREVVSLLRIGEESGSLQENLQLALQNEEKNIALRSKVFSVLGYPLFILMLTAILGVLVVWFVIPRVVGVFTELEVDLPLQTRIVVAMSNWIATYGLWVLLLVIATGGVGYWMLFRREDTRQWGESLLLRLPVISTIVRYYECSRMGYTMSNLLQAGYSLTDSLQLLGETTQLKRYRELYRKKEQLIREGNSIREAAERIPEFGELFPREVVTMVVFAERSGSFTKTFDHIGNRYEARLSELMKRLPSIMEPVILIIVWAAVLVLAYALIGPMYSVIQGIGV